MTRYPTVPPKVNSPTRIRITDIKEQVEEVVDDEQVVDVVLIEDVEEVSEVEEVVDVELVMNVEEVGWSRLHVTFPA